MKAFFYDSIVPVVRALLFTNPALTHDECSFAQGSRGSACSGKASFRSVPKVADGARRDSAVDQRDL